MIIRVEIDTQTKAGKKVYELKKELIQLIDAEQKKREGEY